MERYTTVGYIMAGYITTWNIIEERYTMAGYARAKVCYDRDYYGKVCHGRACIYIIYIYIYISQQGTSWQGICLYIYIYIYVCMYYCRVYDGILETDMATFDHRIREQTLDMVFIVNPSPL